MIKPEIFVTRIGCTDGREIDAISTYVKRNCVATYVDSIDAPGMVALLSEKDEHTMSLVREELKLSLGKRESKMVIVSGHESCESNPVTNVDHHVQIHKAADVVRDLLEEIGFPAISVKELWVQSDIETNEWYAEYIGIEGRIQLGCTGGSSPVVEF